MKKLILITTCAALVVTSSAPAVSAGTLLVSESVFKAAQKEEKHPDEVFAGVLIPTRLAKANICIYYSNTTRKEDQGLIRARAVILDRSGDAEKTEFLTLNGRVKNNEAIICKKAPTLRPGDGVTFEIKMEGMPRLRRSKARTEMAQIAGVVSQGVTPEDLIPEPPPPPPVPEPKPCPAPAPSPSPSPAPSPSPSPAPAPSPSPAPAPSASLSAADQAAASRLLKGNTKTQLWRYKCCALLKWTAIGPKTQLLAGALGGVNPRTIGVGNTIAAAVADYERKMGALLGGPALTASDLKSLEWFSAIDATLGPTSIRRAGTGPYYGEFYRPNKGALHLGPLGTIAEAVNFFKSHGL